MKRKSKTPQVVISPLIWLARRSWFKIVVMIFQRLTTQRSSTNWRR